MLEKKQKRQTLLRRLNSFGASRPSWRLGVAVEAACEIWHFFGALFHGCSVSVSRVSRISRVRISVSLHRGLKVLSPSCYIHPKSLVYFGFQKNTLPSALPPANYNDENKTNRTALLVHEVKQTTHDQKQVYETVTQFEIQNLNKQKI